MPRFACQLEYNGFGFNGWQAQKNQATVQQTVEKAIRKLEPDAPNIIAAGRTDSGVHAIGQVFHCDLQKDWDPNTLFNALNAHLRRSGVTVLQTARVNSDFNARFSAIGRAYLYRIGVRRAPFALEGSLVWHIYRPLDEGAMRQASEYLIGKHDFTTFRCSRCQASSPVKTLDRLTIERIYLAQGYELRLRFEARSFLHRQVRGIVGTLERVGAGALTPADVQDALEARDRKRCGRIAPAHGLYLERVEYRPNPFRIE